MARLGVPEEQRKFAMGQKIAAGAHGFYMHFEPAYMAEACAAIETIYQVIAGKMQNRTRDLLRPPSMAGPGVGEPELADQPLPGELPGGAVRFALAGNELFCAPRNLRGNVAKFSLPVHQLARGYIDPDKKSPHE